MSYQAVPGYLPDGQVTQKAGQSYTEAGGVEAKVIGALRREYSTDLYRKVLYIKQQQIIRIYGVSHIHTGLLGGVAGR